MAADATRTIRAADGPPRWLIAATVALTLLCLLMAVAETTLWIHFVVDRGEAISLAGLAFILMAGLHLHRQGRLRRSLPLVLPWVLYPVVTQGDQLIDNLTINQMRVIVHAILALLFGAPVAVLVLTAVQMLAPAARDARARRWTGFVPGLRLIEQGNTALGGGLLALTLLLLEIGVAVRYLGTLMVATLILLALGVLVYLARVVGRAPPQHRGAMGRDGTALVALVTSVLLSLGLYVGFKNRPGAYQGSPHFYNDPGQKDALYSMAAVAVGPGEPVALDDETASAARGLLGEHQSVLQSLLGSYYVLDRNYNYSFHNELFLRNTPVVPGFRESSLDGIAQARARAGRADARLPAVLSNIPAGHPLGSLLEDVAVYTAYNLRRAETLERMSGEFARTKAGLQHATHLYEGEGKVLGTVLADLLAKHQRALSAPPMLSVTADFSSGAAQISEAYASRIVGF